jgi:glycosyltransferase involved in cell wall biosynthesis
VGPAAAVPLGDRLTGASEGVAVSSVRVESGVELSVIIPLLNQEQNVPILAEDVVNVLRGAGKSFELIFVNDGSTDGTRAALEGLAAAYGEIRVVSLARNYGQTTAVMAGIDHSRGRLIVPMDGDLQNDPRDIVRLLDKIDEGYDVVSGWRERRADAALSKTLPSRVANQLISFVSGVRLHDYGCSLKVYRREVIEGVRLYGEMHRFIPIYASWQGGRITELPVRHHPRKHGQSNYGLERTAKVLLDLITVQFLGGHLTKPIYIFGGFGFLCIAGAVLVGALTLYLKVADGISLISTPLPLLSAMMMILGIMSVLLGILAELLVRIYFESQGKKPYVIRDTMNFDGG